MSYQLFFDFELLITYIHYLNKYIVNYCGNFYHIFQEQILYRPSFIDIILDIIHFCQEQ